MGFVTFCITTQMFPFAQTSHIWDVVCSEADPEHYFGRRNVLHCWSFLSFCSSTQNIDKIWHFSKIFSILGRPIYPLSPSGSAILSMVSFISILFIFSFIRVIFSTRYNYFYWKITSSFSFDYSFIREVRLRVWKGVVRNLCYDIMDYSIAVACRKMFNLTIVAESSQLECCLWFYYYCLICGRPIVNCLVNIIRSDMKVNWHGLYDQSSSYRLWKRFYSDISSFVAVFFYLLLKIQPGRPRWIWPKGWG